MTACETIWRPDPRRGHPPGLSARSAWPGHRQGFTGSRGSAG